MTRGEELRILKGPAIVADITRHPRAETVYNLEVHEDHTYFVSDATLLVHNQSGIGALDALYRAATRMDRNGFTKARGALQKHASRGGKWPTTATTASQYSADAASHVMEILTNRGTKSWTAKNGRVAYIHPDGRGIRFNTDGPFCSFMN